MKELDDFSSIKKIASKSVQFPRQNCVGVATLYSANHFVEHFAAWCLGAAAFVKSMNEKQSVCFRNRIQLGKLRVQGSDLAVFILAGFAAIDEIFEHRHSVANDINNCEQYLMKKMNEKVTKEILTQLRGNSAQERLLHRLHCAVLVLKGYSSSEAARIYGDSARAVAYWVKRFKQYGLEGLKEESRPGRPSKLNTAQFKRLQTLIRKTEGNSKRENAELLSAFILKEFKISMTPRQCWRILNRLTT